MNYSPTSELVSDTGQRLVGGHILLGINPISILWTMASLRWAASFESVARCRRNYNQNHRIHPHHHNELQKRLRSVWRLYPFHPALSVSPNCVFMALRCFKVSRRKISISFSDSLNWEDISFVVIMNDCCDTDAGKMKISQDCCLHIPALHMT